MVITADAKGRTDGTAYEMLKKINSRVPIVLVSWVEDFVFNEEILVLDKYVVANFTEHGWDGQNKFGKEWDKLFNYYISHPPLVRFVRELIKDTGFYPIEYPCLHEISPIQSEQEFNERPIEVFFSWGLSNPIRPKLHGEIWTNMNDRGYIVCDNIFNISKFIKEESNPRKWVTLNCPHYGRYNMLNILEINAASKLSVSLFGAGRKCFRHTESPINSVMVCQEDNLEWTYPWVHGVNCIKFKKDDDMVSVLNETSKRKDLYEIYVKGVENCRKYHIDNYIKYLEKTINEVV